MKKIAFVTPWYGERISGGAEMETRTLVRDSMAAGADVEVLTTCVKDFHSDWNQNYHEPGLTQENGVAVRRFKVRKRNRAIFDRVNAKLMKGDEVAARDERAFVREMVNSTDLYDFIREHEREYSFFVYIPYMFGTTYHGVMTCPKKAVLVPCLHAESYARMNVFRDMFSKARGLLFNSPAEEDIARDYYDLSKVSTMVLGIGMDTKIDADPERFRRKYRINDPFIIYAGRKDAGKNADLLVRYFWEYKKRNGGSLKLVMIGGGTADIPERISDDIFDLGFVAIQDKYDAYAAAQLLCQPSRAESFSLVIMESWLFKRPVMVNALCDVTRRFVQESGGGLYFADYLEFEKGLSLLLNDRGLADAMGRNGQKYVLENFERKTVAGNFIRFLEELEKEDKKEGDGHGR